MMYLQRTALFDRTVRTIVMNNPTSRTAITVALRRLRRNPFDRLLDTKRVSTKNYKLRWGSLVKDDMRIIWDFTSTRQNRIILLTIGGSKEPLKVYREVKRNLGLVP